MTDRIAAYIVVLDEDVREDDAEAIVTALRMVKRVRSVAPVVADSQLHIAEARASARWRDRLVRLATEG